jgi:hypothetical protein
MWLSGFRLFHSAFQLCLQFLYCKWLYDFLPEDDFTPIFADYYLEQQFAIIAYPPEYDPQSQRDRENRERLIAHFQALLVHLDLAFQQSNGYAMVYYYIKRLPPYQLQLRTMVYAAFYVNPELLVGVTDSLPIWLREIGTIGWPTFLDYPKWCYEADMDEAARNAIFEIRDGLRPWTYGGQLVPVPNEGHPGLLEIHRQLTNSEDLGVYYQPTLRDKVNESSCPDTVFVRVTVTGQRAESGDLILPRGTQWPYNHYGQVRVRRLVDGAPFAVTAWQWIRAREQVIGFTLPKKNPDANPGLVVDLPEYQAYGGLTVSATVLG